MLATVAWAQGQSLPVSDPHGIVATDHAAFIQFLDEARPASVTPEAKAMVLKTLPPEGEITTLDASGKDRVTALHRVLRATQRAGVYEIRVIDVPQAAVGIHGRAVILISKPNAGRTARVRSGRCGLDYKPALRCTRSPIRPVALGGSRSHNLR